MLVCALAGLLAFSPPEVSAPGTPDPRPLRRYLTRPVPNSARHLDHGVLQLAAAGGVPHLYRLEASLGLLDHLTIGVTTHWLAGQKAPRIAPVVTLAFYRFPAVEIGAMYRLVLHRPPEAPLAEGEILPEDERPPVTFEQRTHYFLATTTFTRGLASLGLDLGAAHLRQPHPDPAAEPSAFKTRVVAAGGFHLRIGTRRFGVTAQLMSAPAPLPQVTAELVLDVRPGLFELRPRGGWKPY